MMQHQQVVLTGEKLAPLFAHFNEGDPCFIECLISLGFLKYLRQDYYFIHPTFQEYFTARHLAACLLELVAHCLNESVLDKRIPNYENRLKSLHALIERGIVIAEKHSEVEKYLSLLKTHRRIFYHAVMELDGSQMLLKHLANQNNAIRYKIFEVLHILGLRLWDHQPAWKAILKCLDDKDAGIRETALKVFQASGPRLWEHKPVWEVLLKCLKDRERVVHLAALEVLQGIPLRPLLNYLTHPDSPISFEILAKVAHFQKISFHAADKALWLVDQKGTTRVDLPWEQVQGQLQRLLEAYQKLTREQGLSDFTNGTVAIQNINNFFAEDSRKRSRSAEPAASASASSSANPNAAASLPNFSA